MLNSKKQAFEMMVGQGKNIGRAKRVEGDAVPPHIMKKKVDNALKNIYNINTYPPGLCFACSLRRVFLFMGDFDAV